MCHVASSDGGGGACASEMKLSPTTVRLATGVLVAERPVSAPSSRTAGLGKNPGLEPMAGGRCAHRHGGGAGGGLGLGLGPGAGGAGLGLGMGMGMGGVGGGRGGGGGGGGGAGGGAGRDCWVSHATGTASGLHLAQPRTKSPGLPGQGHRRVTTPHRLAGPVR